MFTIQESRFLYGFKGKARDLKFYLQKPLTVQEQSCGYSRLDFTGYRRGAMEITADLIASISVNY